MVEIVCGESLELLKQLPSKCVNWVLTSPPYLSGNSKSTSATSNLAHSKYIGDEPYATPEQWLANMLAIIAELRRITTDVIMFNVQALSKNRASVYKLIGECSDFLYDDVIQVKVNGVPTSTPGATSNSYEHWLLLCPTGVKKIKHYSPNVVRNFFISKTTANSDYAAVHRATMNPDACFTMLVNYAKGTGLDPFAGTGTTYATCLRIPHLKDQDVTLIDVVPEYCKLMRERFNAD